MIIPVDRFVADAGHAAVRDLLAVLAAHPHVLLIPVALMGLALFFAVLGARRRPDELVSRSLAEARAEREEAGR
ncbi:hypothetical protein [Nocardiopsis composta]|uniref:Uncharacterized protein n=1 Tax=Nocardiopsis composta TaxID=157465 RepID=A0A7W8QIW7_9ACTN|nr:hypothetical protein [Nocardiopsis composta]MBB5431317.1 hypothetical protein [Nocardiopsis composta]